MEEINKKDKLDIFNEIGNEIITEIENEKAFNDENLKVEKAKNKNFILTLLEKMLGKLLLKLKIKIVVSWNDKVLFEYVIPKN